MIRILVAMGLLFVFTSADAISSFTSKPITNLTNVPIPARSDGTPRTALEVQTLIQEGCRERGWSPSLKSDAMIHATITIRNVHVANVEIAFTLTSFSISYVSSENLDYDDKRLRIHRNYNKWVVNLSDTIQQEFLTDQIFTSSGISVTSTGEVDTTLPRTEPEAIGYYFSGRELDLIEGIWTWDDNTYQVAVTRNTTELASEYDFIGIVIRAEIGSWKPGDVKLLLNSTASPTIFTGVYFDFAKRRNNLSFVLEEANLIKVNKTFGGGQQFLIRDYPIGL